MSESNEYNPYTAGQMTLPATQEPTRYAPQEFNPYDTKVMQGGTGYGYPDMTPTPRKPILETSFSTLPTDARPQGFWDTMLAPGEGNVRVGTAIKEAYRDTPPLVGPAVRDWINSQPRPTRAIVGTAADVADTVAKGVGAVGTGITANISEFLSGGNPQLARDLTQIQAVTPVAQATTFGPRMARVGGRDVPTGGEPEYRRPHGTVEQADALYQPLIKEAMTSDFRLHPEFTKEWVSGLDKYGPQSAFERAASPEGTPVTHLAKQLQTASETASLDNIQSIQGIDRKIQTAIKEELKAGRDDNARQMRDMLQEFRDKYTNPPPNMYAGNEAGIQAFRDSIKGYAIKSRMAEIENIVNSTEGSAQPANLIASRLNAFLNSEKNVRGWSTEEKAAVKRAANSGYIEELMRYGGSRLGALIASSVSGVPIVTGPANVGLSMFLRNTAESRRIAAVNEALATLGYNIPQPGKVSPPPGPGIPSPAAMTAARYAPLVGLLGDSLADREANR